MELALILLLLVIIELALTVWLLAKHRQYLGRIRTMEEKIKDANRMEGETPAQAVETPAQAVDMSALLAQATPEDMAAAAAILEKLGIKE